jgi:hypothetical protein
MPKLLSLKYLTGVHAVLGDYSQSRSFPSSIDRRKPVPSRRNGGGLTAVKKNRVKL